MFSLAEACGVSRATALFAGSAGSQAEKLGALTSLGSLGAGTVSSLAGTARGHEAGPARRSRAGQNRPSYNETFFSHNASFYTLTSNIVSGLHF